MWKCMVIKINVKLNKSHITIKTKLYKKNSTNNFTQSRTRTCDLWASLRLSCYTIRTYVMVKKTKLKLQHLL